MLLVCPMVPEAPSGISIARLRQDRSCSARRGVLNGEWDLRRNFFDFDGVFWWRAKRVEGGRSAPRRRCVRQSAVSRVGLSGDFVSASDALSATANISSASSPYRLSAGTLPPLGGSGAAGTHCRLAKGFIFVKIMMKSFRGDSAPCGGTPRIPSGPEGSSGKRIVPGATDLWVSSGRLFFIPCRRESFRGGFLSGEPRRGVEVLSWL